MSIKHRAGSIMVWVCIGYKEVGRLEIVDGTMDSFKYVRILGYLFLS